jgi:2-C-methyl-D-erythritol 2,4-cyclodiphosphate synthase
VLLARTLQLVVSRGLRVSYLDATIIAERPVLNPFIGQMQRGLAACLGLGPDSINVKAKTTDGLGFVGRGEGVAALAIATIGPAT